jgi:F-type H+-transporting ATPase subunit b
MRSRIIARLGVALVGMALLGAPLAWAAPAKTGAAEEDATSATSASGHAAGATAKGGLPPFLQPNAYLAFWTLIVFGGLLWVLGRFAWKPLLGALQSREQHLADNLAAAERQNQEARRLLGEYQKKLDNSQAEVREILEEARRDARHTHDEILVKAREESQRERDRAVRDIDLATQSALKELGEKSVNLAVELAGKIVATKLSGDDHARMVKEAVARFASRN